MPACSKQSDVEILLTCLNKRWQISSAMYQKKSFPHTLEVEKQTTLIIYHLRKYFSFFLVFFLFLFCFCFFLFFLFFLVKRINVLRLYHSVLILETECFNDFTQMLYLLLSWVSIMLKYTHVSDDMVSRAKALINFTVRASFHLLHCVKISGIWSFSRPYFPALGLNTER